MATRFHIDAVFKALDKFSAPVVRMTTAMQRFTRRVRKGMGGIAKMTKRMARGFRNSALTLGSLAVMGGFAFKGLVGPAMRFEHAMDGVNAVTLGAYTEHMPKLRKEALRLGKNTTFTATQVANAMEILAKSGLGANKTLALIEPTLLGAEAAASDISTMADIMVSTIEQMGQLDPLRDGERVINSYAVAATSANTTLEELGEGMKKVIPIGEGLGFTFEDLLATTTLLQHMGIEASMSASQQRTFFTRLTNLTPKAASSFRAMGIEILDANKNMKPIPELLAAVAKGFANVKGNAPQIKKMAQAVGLRGGIAGNILIRNMDKLEEILLNISKNAGGAAEKMADMRLDNLYGDVIRLKSAWEFFRIGMASTELEPLRELVQDMTEWLGKPENINAAAEKWAGVVRGMKTFWDENKSNIADLAESSWKTVTVLAGIIASISSILPGWDEAEKINDSWIGRIMNSIFGGEEWREYYRKRDAGLIGIEEVHGLAPGYTQEKSQSFEGEIIIRDQSGVVVGAQSKGLGMSVIQEAPPSGGFTPNPVAGMSQ